MSVFVRRPPLLPLLLSLSSLLTVRVACAQSVATNPVGYVQIACTGSSDTVVSVPFMQPAIFSGTVQAISGNVVTVSSTSVWTANQLVYSGSGESTYFAQFGPGASATDPKDGSSYTITANGTNSVTLALNGDTISAVPVGSAISVAPYWTIATVFPASNELSVNANGSFAKSSSTRLSGLNTQILIPSYSGTGVNLSTANSYYFYNGVWNLYGETNPNHVAGDDVLINNGYFVVRNANTPTTTLTALGSVAMGNSMLPLATEASIQQDNPVAIPRPVPVQLNALGLANSAAFTTSTSTRLSQLADQLLVFSGTSTGFNPSASATYYYYQGHWALYGDLNGAGVDHGTDTIPAGSGFVIRKEPTGTGASTFWQNPSPY